MKKVVFLISVLCMVSIMGIAQEAKWGVGVNLGYGTDVSKAFLGARAHYDITEAFTVAASFNHYFKETVSESVDVGEYGTYGVEGTIKMWELNADFHWNVWQNDILKLYPLAGLTYLHGKASTEVEGITVSDSDGEFGVNLGVGCQFDFADNWAAGVEAKYQIVDGGQFVPMASVMYRF